MDQDRPTPSPTQQDPPPPTTATATAAEGTEDTSAFRPHSSSSRKSFSARQQQSSHRRARPYRHGNSSSTSIDSTTFLDHRDQPQSLTRNMSIPHTHTAFHTHDRRRSRFRKSHPDGQYSSNETSDRDEEQEEEDDETMRLMASARQFAPWTKPRRPSMDESSRLLGSSERLDMYGSSNFRGEARTTGMSPPRGAGRRSSPTRGAPKFSKRYSVINHPSSVPSSIGSPPPRARTFSLVGTGADGETVSMPLAQRAQRRLTQAAVPPRSQGDVLIDIDEPTTPSPTDLSALPPITGSPGNSSTPSSSASIHSRRKMYKAEEDICFPTEEPSGKAPWPNYEVLEEWAAQEGKSLDEGSSAVRDGEGGFLSREGHRKVSEPVMVDGRYRRAYTFPSATPYETDESRPYRFTFFTDKLATTIHSPTISELVDEGEHYSELFEGDAVECWWLDVCGVTDDEMRTLSRAFSIHPLTTEDIATLEPREKVELFRSYYLVSLRSFEQDPASPTYLAPLSIYMIVFKYGIMTFHSTPTPHPANVRRRIRQLKDYIQVSADWICYALIDDIVDGFAPLLEGVEQEVDAIDEGVLHLHKEEEDVESGEMLQRIGLARKKVMGLLRLLGSKADVIKGFSKRCNEKWEVAPRSEIGLYLGDIQDHIITMVQNLNHYEKILSRSHSNYLAQISIEMAKANNDTNDTLSRLTVLGTILVPMNLVTGLWGMNVLVPGQGEDRPTLTWFFSSIVPTVTTLTAVLACLACFAFISVIVLRRTGLV